MNTNNLFQPLVSCWICGNPSLMPVQEEDFDFGNQKNDPVLWKYHDQHFMLMHCNRCDFMQPDKLPIDNDFFDRLYSLGDGEGANAWREYLFNLTFRDFVYEEILKKLEQLIPRRDRFLLDIGCSTGNMLLAAKNRGWQVDGYETDEQLAKFTNKKTGVTVHSVSFDQLITDNKQYQAITLNDVLEHIPNPVPFLSKVYQLLAPGGWIAVKSPFGRRQLLKEQIKTRLLKVKNKSIIAKNMLHINHFSPTSLKLALEQAGLTKVRIAVGAPELIPGQPTSQVFRMTVYELTRLSPFGVYGPTAFNLQAFGKKV